MIVVVVYASRRLKSKPGLAGSADDADECANVFDEETRSLETSKALRLDFGA
jgi:hypothetical protein